MNAIGPGTQWWFESFEGRSLADALRDHDMGTIFRFLRSRGWSRVTIAAATGLGETRVRAIAKGEQRITAYAVLVRVADGLHIPRDYMGLAYRSPTRAVIRIERATAGR